MSRKLQPKYYTSIRVSSGDTLWDIAKEYRTEEYSDISSYIAEVREINHLSSNQITDGMYLCIPYYSEEYKSWNSRNDLHNSVM